MGSAQYAIDLVARLRLDIQDSCSPRLHHEHGRSAPILRRLILFSGEVSLARAVGVHHVDHLIAVSPLCSGVRLVWSEPSAFIMNMSSRPVDGQRKCPAKWPAKMSLVLLAMITDGSYSTRSRFMGGLRASMYFFAVSRWMPSSRATPRVDNPLRFAF